MKTLRSVLFSVVVFCAFGLFVSAIAVSSCGIAVAESSGDAQIESDSLFMQVLDEVVQTSETDILVEKRMLYDLDLKELGTSYEFQLAESSGYAIIIVTELGPVVTELSVEGESPFRGCIGKPVYVRELCYWSESNGMYYALDGTGAIANKEGLENAYEAHYGAVGETLQEGSRTINYISKSENGKSLAKDIPAYIYDNEPNSCGATAGANIVAYYDRYSTNLIPNYNPGAGIGAFYKYSAQNAVITNLISQLYDDMEVGSSGPGVTVDQFKNGLIKYCTRAGYDVVFEGCVTNNKLDYHQAKIKFDEKKPIVMFVSSLEIVDIQDGNNSSTHSTLYGNIMHALAAFGYKEITYTLPTGREEKYEFLHVATGICKMPTAYLNINNMLQTYDAFSISIGE